MFQVLRMRSVSIPTYFLHILMAIASAVDDKFKALMNIDGRDTLLTSVSEVKNKRGSMAIDRSGNLKVSVNYIRTSPEYEGASYDATITITRDRQTQKIAATGACGI